MFSLLALTAAAAAALFSPSAHAATICNGSPELCTRRYSSVTFIGAHNSYAVGSNVADNQYKDVTAQLNDGVRTLQIQAHSASDGVRLCHGSCTFRDAGLIGDYLGKVAGWVGAHPTEVVSMVIVNSNNVPATTFASAFSAAGLDQYAFTPSAGQLTLSEWPTLGSMIDSGRRVVVFIDNQANFAQVPYLIDEFSNMWEDAYNAVDQTFGCAVNRSRAAPAQSLMLINHYLDYTGSIAGTQFFLPDKDRLNQTNAASGQGSIGYHVGNCAQIWGRNPNHILLDFYDSNGNAPFTLAAQLNGVTLQSPAAVTPFTQTARVTGAPSGGSSGSAGGVGGANNAAVTQSRLSGAERVGGSGVGPAAAAVAMAMVMGVAGVMLGAGMV